MDILAVGPWLSWRDPSRPFVRRRNNDTWPSQDPRKESKDREDGGLADEDTQSQLPPLAMGEAPAARGRAAACPLAPRLHTHWAAVAGKSSCNGAWPKDGERSLPSPWAVWGVVVVPILAISLRR